MDPYITYGKTSTSAAGVFYGIILRTLILLLLLFCTHFAQAQGEQSYDEISITLNVQRIGNVDVTAIIKNQAAYLPIKDVFDFLKIKHNSSADLDSIFGFIINPQASFLVSKHKGQIIFRDKIFELKPTDLIKTESGLFLKSDFFGQVFGLDCVFDFRSLSVVMKTRIELPAILEMQQQQMRRNISQLKGERKADTILKRKNPFFALGMADWSVHSTQQVKGISNTIVNLGLGAIVAGGEVSAYLNHVSNTPFNNRQQFYRWRFVNNERKALRQVSLGNVFVQSIASIDATITGVQFTNAPTTYKRSFGTYTLSNKTEPEWTVELYINNVLVNYTKADASGFYSFEVPTVYGKSIIKLRYISPWGEEKIVEEYINIPYTFLAAKQFEYMFTAGIVSNEEKSKFSKLNFGYGLTNRITVGGGVEYMSGMKETKMPFINASLRVGSNIVVTGEHSYKIKSKGILTYKLPSNLQLDITYVKYDPYQTAIRTSYTEEKRAVLSLPFRTKKFSSFYRLSYNEATVQKARLSNAEFLISTIFSGINTNLTTYGVFIPSQKPFVYSNFSVSFRLPAGIRVSPQIQYEYRDKRVSMVKCEAEKNLFKQGSVNLSYEKFMTSNNQVIGLGFRYNFSAAQGLFSVRQNNNSTLLTQSARGSLLYNEKTKRLNVSNQNNVGRGGLHVRAFLDLNANGKKDKGEPAAAGLKLNINGGRVRHSKQDTSITISGLEAYANYFIEINKNSFDNIAWQIRNTIIKVTVEPNHFKEIEIPVAVMGEISGIVSVEENKVFKGLGRIIVNIYANNTTLVARTLTEADGYFNYIGLPPGLYTARIDEAQLIKLSLTPSLPERSFQIKVNKDGEVVDGLNFTLKKLEK